MVHHMDLTRVSPKCLYDLGPGFGGRSPGGQALGFTNYHMTLGGKAFYGVSGEIHFARLWEHRWEEAILKMKAGGINVISTYVFWIHHEAQEGIFDFAGRRDLRRFVQLCGKHGLYVVVRIGPFCHGEVRNGGLPDWLYGKPFQVRSLEAGFLACTRRWYQRLAQELTGLYFGEGGPIIAAQIDNEYMHSAAPWELTSGCTNEWVPAGADGEAYMLGLRVMARDAGICPPFYTCTGWGGAATPSEMMPLWGGYAFRPWLFYSQAGEHPATEEYLYRDNHNNGVSATYNFEPAYPPESKPYLCCEMGGGMFCSYHYRFQLPDESVDAMANIKLGSGCNMLGYYMYHGGTNPRGQGGLFLNEGQVPKLSYDFQAPLGEFGQPRASYRRLRALHLFTKSFEESLCLTQTVLPQGSQAIAPADNQSLRYCVRLGADGGGFLFLNNYQDHASMADKQNETLVLKLRGEGIVFEGLSLRAGENAILPFNLVMGGVRVRTAHAQPLTLLEAGEVPTAFFFAPAGMAPRYTFPVGTRITPVSPDVEVSQGGCVQVAGGLPCFRAAQQGGALDIITLTRDQSLDFAVVAWGGRRVALMTPGVVMAAEDCLWIAYDQPQVDLRVFPPEALHLEGAVHLGQEGAFVRYRLACPALELIPQVTQVGPTRYTVSLPPWDAERCSELLLRIYYQGDVGQAFIDGEMVSDNFCNGGAWDIGLREHQDRLADGPLTLYITPLKQGSSVNVSSAMAGRREESTGITGGLSRVEVLPVYQWHVGKANDDRIGEGQ